MTTQSTTLEPRADELTVRPVTTADGDRCAEIFYDAFAAIATRHGFPIEPSSPAFTRYKISEMLASEGFVGLVAERDGEVLGSAFIDERALIAGIGPVTVAPAAQDTGVGRTLMQAALDRDHRVCDRVRLRVARRR